MTSFLWDQHTCLPLQITADVDQLTRYRRPGGALVSVNAGYSPHTFAETVALLQYYRTEIEAHPELDVAADLDEVEAITDAGRIAVVFDLEDSRPLDGDLDNLDILAGLGVRTLLPTYNHANRAGSGCLDTADGGLTSWGRSLVSEMNQVGIDHVGVSTDYSFDYADFIDEVTRNPHLFDDNYTRWGTIEWMPPETLLTLGEHLAGRGWRTCDIRAVLGGNFHRVARQAWRATSADPCLRRT